MLIVVPNFPGQSPEKTRTKTSPEKIRTLSRFFRDTFFTILFGRGGAFISQ